MQAAPLAPDEEQRLSLLQALDLLDTPSEPAFDLITRMTANAIGVPIALVSLIDRDRQWFKSKVGMDISETPREYAFCAHCIVGGERLLVPDATQDERFFDNPLVCGAPGVRFYAGIPLRSIDGLALGSLCVLDTVPRQLSANQLDLLSDAAQLANHEIMRREATLRVRTTTESSLAAGLAALEKQVEQRTRELSHAHAQLQTLTDHLPAMIGYFGPDLRYRFVNEAYRVAVGKPSRDIIGRSLAETFGPEKAHDIERHVKRATRRHKRVSFEMPLVFPDGTTHYGAVTLIPDIVEDRIVGFHSIVHDITERRTREQATRLEARRDTLTGLPNRRAVQERLPRAMASTDRRGGVLEVLFLDLDGFKQVNDTLGHDQGDQLLKEIARRLKAGLPGAELVARLSGDEFVVIARDDGGHAQGETMARQILADIAAPMRLAGQPVQIHASLGIAIYRAGSGINPAHLLRAADMAMYEAKRAGRNQYRVSPETR
ncbi:diguanylate cyclase domain-containing protein [Pigmentiphaga sp. NML080357]|uniref:sensor domain-containing diguanylate cyclase n=1 Tax=Pigmentiphaga sp. NML080357 TaxID=2008675 RepID=UPI00130371D4|nr:diguanylate cyclase [Pigmentiphaga sp. NML080357]